MPEIKEIAIEQVQDLHKEEKQFIDFNLFMYQTCREMLSEFQQVNVVSDNAVKYYFTTGKPFNDKRVPNKIYDEII